MPHDAYIFQDTKTYDSPLACLAGSTAAMSQLGRVCDGVSWQAAAPYPPGYTGPMAGTCTGVSLGGSGSSGFCVNAPATPNDVYFWVSATAPPPSAVC